MEPEAGGTAEAAPRYQPPCRTLALHFFSGTRSVSGRTPEGRGALLVLFLVNVLNFYDRQALGAVAEPLRRESRKGMPI